MTQDALYAMRYDPDGLAQGAFDARLERYGSKRLARSPGIDAGSDDAWGYDSTSTHPKIIDMGQPDIGYHYYRRVADDDPVDEQDIRITFRVPHSSEGQITGFQADYPENSGAVDPISLPTGSDVIEHRLFPDNPIETGPHDIQVVTNDSSGRQSAPTEIKLIVDPDPPTVAIQ